VIEDGILISATPRAAGRAAKCPGYNRWNSRKGRSSGPHPAAIGVMSSPLRSAWMRLGRACQQWREVAIVPNSEEPASVSSQAAAQTESVPSPMILIIVPVRNNRAVPSVVPPITRLSRPKSIAPRTGPLRRHRLDLEILSAVCKRNPTPPRTIRSR